MPQLQATPRQLGVLRQCKAAGGYLNRTEDADTAEECAAASWLIAEDTTGYALTLLGSDILALA